MGKALRAARKVTGILGFNALLVSVFIRCDSVIALIVPYYESAYKFAIRMPRNSLKAKPWGTPS
jgi:hypothetical protein